MNDDDVTYRELSVGDCITNRYASIIIIGKLESKEHTNCFDFIVFSIDDDGIVKKARWVGLAREVYCLMTNETLCKVANKNKDE